LASVYLSKGFIIDPNRQTIERDGKVISVRSKTFALLVLFIEKPQELLSKRYLLDTVWDDVVVEEPVLVQSIRELRQLFGSADIIQTYPRKGYSWSEPVQQQFESVESHAITTPQRVSKTRSNLRFFLVVALCVITVILIIFFAARPYSERTSPTTEVVIVLPVKNEMLGSNYNWVPLGAMDQLINLLQTDSTTQILNAEYVLQLKKYAQLPHDKIELQVSRIFEVSGASLVVETKLSGSMDDYRLDYKLHRKKDIKLGVIFDSNLEHGLQKLGVAIAESTGVTTNTSVKLSENAFQNELMARALEKMDAGDFLLANHLLLSLTQLEPNNIVAREMLSRSFQQLQQFDAAQHEVKSALAMANQKESTRLYFLLAEIQIQQGRLDNALETLSLASTVAQSINDNLYLGYIAQLRATIYQERSLFPLSIDSYEQAIKYFSLIRCPIGISITHLQMAKVFVMQGNIDSANTAYLAAKKMIENHRLHKLENSLTQMEGEIRSAL
jgi:DNA-binding winged helix-turn-helix (wHTH) protein/tetratricopeptide (TPR) repeat protein